MLYKLLCAEGYGKQLEVEENYGKLLVNTTRRYNVDL